MGHEHGDHAAQRAEVAALQQAGADPDRPRFDEEWQRRAFGVAVALSEFGHYPWATFQQQLIDAVAAWEALPAHQQPAWSYFDCWLEALARTLETSGLLTVDELELIATRRP